MENLAMPIFDSTELKTPCEFDGNKVMNMTQIS